MSLNLVGLGGVPYVGTVYTIPTQIAGVQGLCAPLNFNWLAYGASEANSNINVLVDLGGGGNRAPLDRIRTIYIDNLASNVPIFVQFIDTLFTVTAQPNSAGWYPVFTNSQKFIVGAFGFTNVNIPSSAIYVTNILVPPYTDISVQSVYEQQIASPTIGGGAGLNSISIINPSFNFASGALIIAGGGGNGAAAHGVLDALGRFSSPIIIDTPGTQYIGIPIITPAGANPTSAAWISGHNYLINDRATYAGSTYYATQNTTLFNNTVPPPQIPNTWSILGPAVPPSAVFGATLTPISPTIQSSGFGVPALGDQAQSVIDAVTGTGIFRTNLWGTPFNSGFIYLTHFDVNCLVTSTLNIWQLEDDAGYIPFPMEAGAVGRVLSLQKMNMKLDATATWRLKCTTHAGNFTVQHGFAGTYAP